MKQNERGEMMDKKEGKGLKILLICGIIAMILIILCVFFPEQFFGLFSKQKKNKKTIDNCQNV